MLVYHDDEPQLLDISFASVRAKQRDRRGWPARPTCSIENICGHHAPSEKPCNCSCREQSRMIGEQHDETSENRRLEQHPRRSDEELAPDETISSPAADVYSLLICNW